MKPLLAFVWLAILAAFYWTRAKIYFFFVNLFKRRKHKARTLIPKGHNIYYFNPKEMTLTMEEKNDRVATGRKQTKSMGIQTTKEMKAYDITDVKIKKGNIVIIALNFINANRKAIKLLKTSGHESDKPSIKFVRIST